MSVIEIAAASLLKREDSYLKLPGKGNMSRMKYLLTTE